MSNLHSPWLRGVALILAGLATLCGALLLFPHSPDLYLWFCLSSGVSLTVYGSTLVILEWQKRRRA